MKQARAIFLIGVLGVTGCGSVQFPSSAPPRDINTPPQQSRTVVASTTGNVSRPNASRVSAQSFVNASAVIVGPGDTVYELSRRHRVPVPAIIRANDLRAPYLLHVGQRIELPRGAQHKVIEGDTLYSVAQKFDVGVYELARLNAIDAPYTIKLGEILVIPAPQVVTKMALPRAQPARKTTPQAASKVKAPLPAKRPVAPPRKTERVAVSPSSIGKIAVIPPRKPSAPVPPPPARTGKGFVWPVKGPLLSSFGVKDGGLRNDGINIKANRGAPVRAAENGVVAYAGNEIRGFGNLLLIKHADGYVTAYAHNEDLVVQRGQRVKRGQKIATVGSSGSVARPQLHFEVRKGRRPQDPKKYLTRSS